MGIQADEFVTQAREHLTVLEQVLLTLEKPDAGTDVRERVDRCLRIVHSIKGDAGFLGYTAIRTLANAFETVLENLRVEDSPAPTSVVERLLAARDRLATLVDDLENSNLADLGELLSQLERLGSSIPKSAERMGHRPSRAGPQTVRSPRGVLRVVRALGVVSAATIDMEPAELARGLPEGPIRFRARLVSASSRDDIRRVTRVATAHRRRASRNAPCP